MQPLTDAFIDAKAINVKDSTVGTASVIGAPDLVNFIRSLLKGLSNKLKASTKSASTVTGSSKQGTISSLLSAAPSDFSSVGLAAGIAVPESTNAAEARIGSRAVVTVKRNLRLNSRAEDNFKVIATGDSGGSAQADFGGGVAVATLSNTSIASLDNGADVQVDGQTRVMSNAVYPNPSTATFQASASFHQTTRPIHPTAAMQIGSRTDTKWANPSRMAS